MAAFGSGAVGDFRGVARAGGFRDFGNDAAVSKNVARFIERAAAGMATVAGIRVVNQERVVEFGGHLAYPR